MIGEEGIDVGRVREPPVISRILPSMTANFRTRSGVVSNFDLRVRIALSDIFGNDVPVQLVDAVLIDAFG